MKRRTPVNLAASFLAVWILVPGAAALEVKNARIKNAVVEVKGKDAVANSTITWEGQPIAQANARGRFKFETTVLPLDCVGEVSDGVETAPAVVKFCEMGVCEADVDFTTARAFGLGPIRLRLSGVELAGDRSVTDLMWTGTGLDAGSFAPSLPPSISGGSVGPVVPGGCGPGVDQASISFGFQDPNGDVDAGRLLIKFENEQSSPAGATCTFNSETSVDGRSSCSVVAPGASTGTITCTFCFENVSRSDVSLKLRDADENESLQTVQVSIDL